MAGSSISLDWQFIIASFDRFHMTPTKSGSAITPLSNIRNITEVGFRRCGLR
ncbi:hypothetical protein NSU_0078 [Novosphingobium pentaromativorans US6-1]|uniref:Uncharacterized protein n=1 Tax=Novosphingobium pentaromativorans US6-1 TaxID=1088721 RepID=G6E6V8_9SPHN|nr:hypothetical protein NSU_0078 [Novosphingobium pentaromativorans US6-1]